MKLVFIKWVDSKEGGVGWEYFEDMASDPKFEKPRFPCWYSFIAGLGEAVISEEYLRSQSFFTFSASSYKFPCPWWESLMEGDKISTLFSRN